MASEIDQILALAARAATPIGNNNGAASASIISASSPSIIGAGSAASPSYQIYSANDNPQNCQPHDLAPALPLNQYQLNIDPNPEIIRKKPIERVQYNQNVAVRYLRPPAPAPAGDIVIQQLPDRQVAPAPAHYVRQQQPSQPTPLPLIIREAPPPPPPQIPGQYHQIPGKIIPPPARKVITEYLPPCPAKPQQIIVDRWLPYEAPQQRVIYQPAKPPCLIPNPRNVNIIWSEPDVEVTQVFINLGVHNANPAEYIARYGPSLVQHQQLPEIAQRFSSRGGYFLAAEQRQAPQPILIGDVQYLSLIQRN